MQNSPNCCNITSVQCKLEEAEDFKCVLVVYFVIESK